MCENSVTDRFFVILNLHFANRSMRTCTIRKRQNLSAHVRKHEVLSNLFKFQPIPIYLGLTSRLIEQSVRSLIVRLLFSSR